MAQESQWLVVMTKPKMETEAKEHLIRQKFEVYLPFWMELNRQKGSWKKVQSPMFPRYLFARPSYAEQSLSPIRSTWGVSQLVRFGIEPAWAREDLICEIRHLERSRTAIGQNLTPFKKGDHVQIMEGPFKGILAEVFSCSQQRVVLLLQLLGKTQQLAFDANACQQQARLSS